MTTNFKNNIKIPEGMIKGPDNLILESFCIGMVRRSIEGYESHNLVIRLGEVDILTTTEENLETDFYRVKNQVEEGKIRVVYELKKFIPKLELIGEHPEIINGMKKILSEKGFDSSEDARELLGFPKEYTPFVTAENRVRTDIEIYIGQRNTNPHQSGYLVSVSLPNMKPSSSLLSKMCKELIPKDRVLGSYSFDSSTNLSNSNKKCFTVIYSLLSREIPKDVASSLVKSATKMTDFLMRH